MFACYSNTYQAFDQSNNIIFVSFSAKFDFVPHPFMRIVKQCFGNSFGSADTNS